MAPTRGARRHLGGRGGPVGLRGRGVQPPIVGRGTTDLFGTPLARAELGRVATRRKGNTPMTTIAPRSTRRRRRGMTLIEIIVVISILALMAAAVGVAVLPQFEQAKRDRAALDINQIESALKFYYAKKGNYPDTASG